MTRVSYPTRRARVTAVAILVDERRDLDLVRLPVEARHLADQVAERVPVRVRQVVGLEDVEVHASCSDLVQVRLPEMRARPLDQRDLRPATTSQRVAEAGRELEAACASADDHDPMQGERGGHALLRWVARPFLSGASASSAAAGRCTPPRRLRRPCRSIRQSVGCGWIVLPMSVASQPISIAESDFADQVAGVRTDDAAADDPVRVFIEQQLGEALVAAVRDCAPRRGPREHRLAVARCPAPCTRPR